MNLLKKIVAADEGRKSRLHDLQGKPVGLVEILSLPARLFENLAARQGRYVDRPWWPPQAIARISELLHKDAVVVEFGSGMSTAWLAKRVKRIVAVDSNPEWKARTEDRLRRSGLDNATVRYAPVATYIANLDLDEPIDLVIVDGERRADCIDWAVSCLAVGSYIYLDNSDRDNAGDSLGSRTKMLKLATEGLISIEAYRGYPSAQLAPTEGMLARVVRRENRTGHVLEVGG